MRIEQQYSNPGTSVRGNTFKPGHHIIERYICLIDRRIIMLDFDEEIKKFQPSLEVEDAEDAIYNNDVPDITELITKIIDGKSER